MLRFIVLFALLVTATPVFSAPRAVVDLQMMTTIQASTMGLVWKVGDATSHEMKVAIINGTIDARVREEAAEGFWLEQNMDLGFAGKQKVESLIDKNDGHVIKMIVNGKEQSPPARPNMEVVEMREEQITVPAGSFDCVYMKLRNKEDNKEYEAWINPKIIPINGMLKMIAGTDMGPMTQELKSFIKN